MSRQRSAGSLRRRLMVRLALMLSLLLVLAAISAYWNARDAADTAYDRSLLSSARTIVGGLFDAEGRLSVEVPYIALDNFAYDITGRLYYQVLDRQGRGVSGYEDLPAAPPGTPMTRDYPALARFYDGHYRGAEVRLVSLLQPVSIDGEHGMAEVRVAETLNAREGMARGLLHRSLINLGVLSVSALILVWLTVNAALGPLRRVKDEVTKRRSDDLSPISTEGLQREISPLVDAINHFTGQLKGNFERQRDFIAEASHELRTPLSALKARIEFGLRSSHPEQWHQALQDAELSTDRTIALANRLLSMARIERGARAVADGSAELIAMQPLAQEVAMAMVPLAHGRGVELALEVSQPFTVWGERTLLQELLGNLIDNALAHTPAGGQIILRLTAGACLEVEDTGPGIPETERNRVFERFYRQGGTGSGLGLSIVGEICRAHRAQISLEQGELGGLLVRVRFPDAPNAKPATK
ncbi:sensor histidine kinase [Pseudomonas sp. FME51]|uniref:sensor histidine kinase n=1 Tax=Pseudomonas sp. FME51 TaxID=2742609 RepID=UPI001868E1F1|nr:sensor histidine kinase [Pseudomonas sp. FME51]